MAETFNHVCSVLAAVRCLNAGQSFQQVAASAGKSESTVRRWVSEAGFTKTSRGWRR